MDPEIEINLLNERLTETQAELKATRETLETLIVWLALELGEKAVDKLLSKLSGEADASGQNAGLSHGDGSATPLHEKS